MPLAPRPFEVPLAQDAFGSFPEGDLFLFTSAHRFLRGWRGNTVGFVEAGVAELWRVGWRGEGGGEDECKEGKQGWG